MFVIVGSYHGEREIIDSAESLTEARELASEYRLAFGAEWSISFRRARRGELD